MSDKRTFGERVFDRLNEMIMICVIIATLYPVYYVIVASISDAAEIMKHRGVLLRPLGLSFAAYGSIFRNNMILLGYRNTIFVVVVGTAFNVVLTSLGAYFLSRKKIFLQRPVMILVVFTMFFNGGLIPTFLNIKALGLFDSLWALIIPAGVSTYNLIIMRTSFMAIPASLEESAYIDGAHDMQLLTRVILPLSKPVIAVMILYYGVSHWNSWFSALLYLRDRGLYPLQMLLREILIYGSASNEAVGTGSDDVVAAGLTIKYATIVVATLPILCVYPFLQKYFTKGIMIGALKG